jgi:predicted RNA polymerase sigma factor
VTDVREILDGVWRADAPGMLGVLTRRLDDLDRAEEALQDAIAEALRVWPGDGVPDNPPGWLVTTAWRKAVDRLRREATGRRKDAELAALESAAPAAPTGDDRLAMLFACCHPALPETSRVALTLHVACGLPAETVAAAFLLPRATAAQRLVRAKRLLRERNVRVVTPSEAEYPDRLPAVLQVIYLLHNEGYLSAGPGPDGPVAERRELAREALELARRLTGLLPGEPEVAGLTALLELTESRAATRFGPDRRLVLLADQDRSRWDTELIATACRRLARAAGDRPGRYQLEASIAAQHALAPAYEQTDWVTVRRLYDLLATVRPTPVVLLGRAVATGFAVGPAEALAEVDALGGRLDGYRLWHATRADLLRELGRDAEAAEATRRALALATNPAERELLTRRLDDLDGLRGVSAPGPA